MRCSRFVKGGNFLWAVGVGMHTYIFLGNIFQKSKVWYTLIAVKEYDKEQMSKVKHSQAELRKSISKMITTLNASWSKQTKNQKSAPFPDIILGSTHAPTLFLRYGHAYLTYYLV